VRGLWYRPLPVETEHGIWLYTRPQFGHPPPAAIAWPGCSISGAAVTDKIDVDVLVGRLVSLEIAVVF
jgi:hypothetical protein